VTVLPVPLDPMRVWAVMPSYDDVPEPSLVEELLGHVGGLIIVDDGSRPRVAGELRRIATHSGVELVQH
jgi:hypothetical protein